MNTLVVLAAILFILMVGIGGTKGVRSYVSLFLNFAVVVTLVILMASSTLNPIILTLAACVIISLINLFYISEINSKTVTAFIATMLTITFLFLFIYLVTKKMKIQGFGEEELEGLRIFSLHIGVDFVRISSAVIIMSTIGAITDVAISITSPMQELINRNRTISQRALIRSGLIIGRDILGSNTNTLFFAFIGGYMGLLIWFKDLSYSFGEVINSKIFSAEMVTIMFAGIGIAMIIPITVWLNAVYLIRQRTQAEKGNEDE